MSPSTTQDRLALKTPEAAFLRTLQEEFQFSQRVSQELLQTAQEMLNGNKPSTAVRPGQVRLVVASLKAPFGPSLAETEKVEITLTVDAGDEDRQVKAKQGIEKMRQGQILRLTEEALEQGGILTQEDLARALGVERRTIVRAIKELKADGHLVQTRGMIKGVGRGQTHKVKIIELWLDRQGYDKIERWVRHSAQSIKRYVSAFLRVSSLHRQGVAEEEIAFLTGTSLRLVKDYIELYTAALETPHRCEKLQEELERVAPQASDEGEKTVEAAR